jgi:hypothetical protein
MRSADQQLSVSGLNRAQETAMATQRASREERDTVGVLLRVASDLQDLVASLRDHLAALHDGQIAEDTLVDFAYDVLDLLAGDAAAIEAGDTRTLPLIDRVQDRVDLLLADKAERADLKAVLDSIRYSPKRGRLGGSV